jgi:hypothetical protein
LDLKGKKFAQVPTYIKWENLKYLLLFLFFHIKNIEFFLMGYPKLKRTSANDSLLGDCELSQQIKSQLKLLSMNDQIWELQTIIGA